MNLKNPITPIVKMSIFLRTLFTLLLTTFSLYANDLIIENYSVVTKLDDVNVTSSELGYLKDSQIVSFDVELYITWDCEPSLSFPFDCRAEKPDVFFAEFYIEAGGQTQVIATDIKVTADEIAYRNSRRVDETTKNFTVTLPTTDTFHSWAAGHYSSGDDFKFAIRIDPISLGNPSGDVPEDDEKINNYKNDLASTDYVPLSGDVAFGTANATLDSFTLLKRDIGLDGCFGTQFLQIVRLDDATFSWNPSSQTGWTPVSSNTVGKLCGQYILNNDAFDLLVKNGSDDVVFGETQGIIAGNSVTIPVTTLTTDGAAASGNISTALPMGNTYHFIYPSGYIDEGKPSARGSRTFIVANNSAAVGDYSELVLSDTINGYLHAEALPFMLHLTSISLSEAEGFSGDYDSVKYLHEVNYNIRDVRSKKKYNARSNDTYLSSPANSVGQFTISSSGLQTSIAFDSGSGRSHYPQTEMKWDPFNLSIVNGQIDNIIIPVTEINMNSTPFASDCGTCDDLALQSIDYTTSVISGTPGVASDGAMAGYVSNMSNPAWGPYDIAYGKHIFTRLNDSGNGIFYYPGFKATGSGGENNVPVSEYLMGMRAMQKPAETLYPDINHLQSSDTAKLGNHFMAGLNLGPEIYSNSSGQVETGIGRSLASRGMTIGFGGPGQDNDHQSLSSTAGTKYVVRRSGVTGVFNLSSVSDISAYGYDLTMSKIAFRQVNNSIDNYNWMEGEVNIGGKANINIAFDSLELECDGKFGDMHIAPGNRAKYLQAWNSPIELLSVGFVSQTENEPLCSISDRQLQIGHTFDLAALDKQLVMNALWSPAGEPSNAKISGESDIVFDRPNVPQGSEEDRGFSMVIDRGIALKTPGSDTDGWIEMNGSVGLPFWEVLDVKARFANKSDSVPAQTIVYEKSGSLSGSSGSDDLKSNEELVSYMENARTSKPSDDPFKARYQWGNSSFGFNMPIFYAPGQYAANEAPRFLGRTIRYDAVVLNSNSGVDFIDSKSTKLSFGASADFEKLRTLEIDLHVDVANPQSVAGLDKYFCKLKGFDSCDHNDTVKGPVSKIVGGVVDKLNVLNNAADSGIDKLIREGVETGVDESIATLGTDPFEEAASVMAKVQTLPQQAATQTSEALKEMTEDMMKPLSDDLDALAKELYTELPEKLAYDASPAPTDSELKAIGDKLGRLVEVINDVRPGLDKAEDKIQDARTELTKLVDEVHGWTNDINNSLTTIKQDILKGLDTGCSFVEDEVQTNKVLHQIEELQKYSLTSVELLGVMDLETFAYILMAFTGVDLTGVATTEKEIRQMTTEIKETITEADEQMRSVLCDENYPDMITESIAFIDDISARIAQADAKIVEANTTLQIDSDDSGDADGGYLGLMEEKIELAEGYLDAAGRVVSKFETAVNAKREDVNDSLLLSSAAGIRNYMDHEIETQLSDNRYGWYDDVSDETFVKRLAEDLRDPIDNGITQISLAVGKSLGPLASNSFHMNKDEFKAIIIDQIMNSTVIENVHRIAYINTTEIVERINNAAGFGFDQVNLIIQNALVAINEKANELIQSATGKITSAIPLKAAKVDGYGLIVGNELDRLHIGAEWTMAGDDEESSSTYGGALDVKNRNSEGEGGGCYSDAASSFDASISASGIPIKVGESDATVSLIEIGFMLEDVKPTGVFGRISIEGSISFGTFELYNLNFGTGIGLEEVYLGASGGAAFDDVQLKLAFLFGKTCSLDLLKSMDPQVGDFITLPNGVFNGAYSRGGASMPIYDYGCAFEVGVSADVGAWFLIGTPNTFGGLVGGGAFGEVVCIGSLRGEVTAIGQKSGDNYTFSGDGFGVAGAGIDCDKHTWTSRERSRKDKWCGTGDAGFKAIYDSGWKDADLSKDSVF